MASAEIPLADGLTTRLEAEDLVLERDHEAARLTYKTVNADLQGYLTWGHGLERLVLPDALEGTDPYSPSTDCVRWPIAVRAPSHMYSTLVNMVLEEPPLAVSAYRYDPNHGTLRYESALIGSGATYVAAGHRPPFQAAKLQLTRVGARNAPPVNCVRVEFFGSWSLLRGMVADSQNPVAVERGVTEHIVKTLGRLAQDPRQHPDAQRRIPNPFFGTFFRRIYDKNVLGR